MNMNELNKKTEIPKVTGRISYEVKVKCPHCQAKLNLNEYPYDDDETDYCLAEDELGAALFGYHNEPATWENIDIEYQCCHCDGKFSVGQIEI